MVMLMTHSRSNPDPKFVLSTTNNTRKSHRGSRATKLQKQSHKDAAEVFIPNGNCKMKTVDDLVEYESLFESGEHHLLTYSRRVKNDRLVKIVVGKGDEQQTFHLQETNFVRFSPAFAAFASNEHLVDSQTGEYRFPEDSVIGWTGLIFWLLGGDLAPPFKEAGEEDEKQLLLIQSWILGSKYGILHCCDELMLELMLLLQRKPVTPENAVTAITGTAPGSKLRKLVCHEIIHDVYSLGRGKIESFGGVMLAAGFAEEMLTALNQYHTDRQNFTVDYVGNAGDGTRKEGWREFMLDSAGPFAHWVYGECGTDSEAGGGESMVVT